MKKITVLILCLMLSVTLAACGNQNADNPGGGTQTPADAAAAADQVDKIVIRVGHTSSEQNTYQDVAEAFRDKAVELLGEDRVEVLVYANATLGSETEMTEAMQMGTLEAAVFGRHASIDPRLEVFNLPFLYVDDAHAERVLRGPEGAEVRALAQDYLYDSGIILLGFYESGFRKITSNRPIETIADLKGLLIRTAISDSLLAAFNAWGASPTPIDFSELYTALQTKVVDAQENPYQLIYTSNFYEIQDYLCVTDHMLIPYELMFSAAIWDSYPADVQEALREAGEYACNVGGRENVRQNQELLEELSQYMTVTYMEESSLAEMKQICIDQVWPSFVQQGDGTQELLEKIQALSD